MKKVLLAVTHAKAGGVAKHVSDLAYYINFMSNSDWEADIVVGNVESNEMIDDFFKSAKNVHFIDGLRREAGLGDFKTFSNVNNFLKSNKDNYDIVHTHGPKASFFFNVGCHRYKIPNVYTNHLVVYRQFKSKFNTAYKILDKISCRRANRVLVVTESVKKCLIEDGIVSGDKITTVYNTLLDNTPKYDRNASRKELNFGEDELIFTCVMRLEKPKDPWNLIYNFEQYCKTNSKAKLIILGNGRDQDEIVNYVKQKKIDNNIIVLGYIKDVEKYLSASDVFVMYTEKEGLPISILEAMKYRLPIIASKVDGIPEEVHHNINGFLITDNTNIEQNIKYFKELESESKRLIMGEKSYDRLTNVFSLENTFGKVLELYKQQLKK